MTPSPVAISSASMRTNGLSEAVEGSNDTKMTAGVHPPIANGDNASPHCQTSGKFSI